MDFFHQLYISESVENAWSFCADCGLVVLAVDSVLRCRMLYVLNCETDFYLRCNDLCFTLMLLFLADWLLNTKGLKIAIIVSETAKSFHKHVTMSVE